MKLASLPDEACFMCQRSLLRWASKPISFFPYIFRKKYSPRTYEMSIKNIVILRILCCLLFLLP